MAPKKEPGGIEMAPRARFVVGDFLVWQGQGLVRVERSENSNGTSYWVMKAVAVGTTMMIPTDTVDKVVRRPVSRPDAARLAGVLRQQTGASDDRPWAVRFHENMVTLIKRPLEVQVNALHTLYRTAYAPTFGERRLIDTLERVVVGELAHVLGRNVDAMIEEVRSGHPAFATTSRRRPPEPEIAEPKAPIALKNHTYLGKFSSPSGSVVVGEVTAPAKDTFVAQGRPGEWHAFVRVSSNKDEGGLVLIHADALGRQAKLLEDLVTIADLNVQGGTMAMISAEVRDDEKFLEATMFPVSPIVDGSGCMVTTGGDGAHRLRGAKIADRFALLVVDF
jgi:RNA polymerase-interacting CarD/CdnL/TRCF family regulator